MRKGLEKLYKILALCMVWMLFPLQVSASETSLTIQYQYGKTTFYFYKIAEFSENGTFTLVDPFTDYVDEVTNLNRLEELNTEEWGTLANTLNVAVLGDSSMKQVYEGQTDENGILEWNGISKGLYLVTGEVTQDEQYIYTPSPTLVTVPNRDAQGKWDSSPVVVHNKAEREEITSDTVEYSVRKIWKDTGNETKRPENIKVTLWMDGKVYETVTLDVNNNWKYTWSELPAGHEWIIDEDTVPEGYTKIIQKDGNEYVITNTYEVPDTPVTPDTPERPGTPDTPDDEKLPQTGQLWWPVPVLVLLGMAVFMIGWVRRRTDNE